MACLTTEQIELLVGDALGPAEAGALHRHIKQCDACQHQFEEARANERALGRLKELPDSAFPPSSGSTPDQSAGTRLPERIGPYRIVRSIGTGGMGVVYEGEQEQPIHRTVAVKVIKLGMDTEAVVSRFVAERQALAIMDHPNIAKVFDAGATDQGKPYFAMEYVAGTRITEYCDQQRLDTTDRLRLFMQVCQAIQHAHQKGIIHRDIKPSNVLIAVHDDKPVPKIIDFGVAKATDQRLSDQPLVTIQGQLLGTLAYMSPEQAEGLDIDTRSDIYSLGVLLYELSTGTTPFDANKLRSAGHHEMLRVIRQEEPRRPSTRVSGRQTQRRAKVSGPRGHERERLPLDRGSDHDLSASIFDIARRRRTDPRTLSRQLRGDLDWIIMRALEKDRAQRYASASDLAADIERHLEHELVVARPPSWRYRLQKFVRRNRIPVGVAAAFLLLITSGLITAFTLWREAEGARASAETARASEAEQKRIALDGTDELRRAHYRAQIGLADSACRSNDSGEMRSRLRRSDEELRGWEWHYLQAISDSSLAVLEGYGMLQCVAVSSDGTQLAAGSEDGTIRRWNASTTEELRTLRGHSSIVHSVAYSPNGSLIASASEDKTVRLWDVSSDDAPRFKWARRCEREVLCVTFSPDGKLLASGSRGSDVVLWDTDTGDELERLPGNYGLVKSIAFSPDGHHLAAASWNDMKVRIWDVEKVHELEPLGLRGHKGGISSVAYSPDGTILATGSQDHTVRIWDALTGKEVRKLDGHAGTVCSVAFSPSGEQLATSSVDATVRLWDVLSGEELGILRGHEMRVSSVAYVSTDSHRLVSASADGTLRIWDAATDDERYVLGEHDDAVLSIAFNSTGTRLASSGSAKDKTVRVWDTLTRELLATLKGHVKAVFAVAFSPDATRLASGSGDGAIILWDAFTGDEIRQLHGHNGSVHALAFNPDGSRLVSASTDGAVHIWDAQSGELIRPLGGPAKAVQGLAFSPDGTLGASASNDKTIHVWNTVTGAMIREFHGHEGAISAIAFSPDGNRLASCSGMDHTVRIWDVAADVAVDEPARVLRVGSFIRLAYSSDGTRLALAGGGVGDVGVWDTASGDRLLTLLGHRDRVNTVAFAPDGTRLASAGLDWTIRIWDSVPYRVRHRQRAEISAAMPQAELIVDSLWQDLTEWKPIARRLREDDSLSEPLRRAALNLVLRRATGGWVPDPPGS